MANRLIVDSHCHLKHGDAQRTEYTGEQVIGAMDGAGIARSVVFAMATTTEASTRMVIEAVRQYPQRLIPYAYALPSYERAVIEELREAVVGLGFKGIKLHIGECTTADYVSGPVFALAGRYGVPCLVDFGGRLESCRDVVTAHPGTTVIIAHFGRYLSRDADLVDQFISLAEQHPNALLDASGVVLLDKIVLAAERIGAERILFGTDGPHSVEDGSTYAYAADTVAYARAAVSDIESLSLGDADKAAILGGNIARLLGL